MLMMSVLIGSMSTSSDEDDTSRCDMEDSTYVDVSTCILPNDIFLETQINGKTNNMASKEEKNSYDKKKKKYIYIYME